MRGVPRARRAISLAPSARHADIEHAGAAGDDLLQLFLGVEIQPHRNAETIAQRIGEQPRARGRADQGEFRQFDLDRARRRSLADDEIELEILHRGIEHFLHRRTEAMDFVDEQDVALFEIGQQRREIAGLGDDRARSRAKTDAELARHDLRQRGLAEAGRADEQHMIQRLVTLARGLDEDRKILARLRLADEFGQQLRTQRGVADIVGTALGVTMREGGFTSPVPSGPAGSIARSRRSHRRCARPMRWRLPPAAGRSRD